MSLISDFEKSFAGLGLDASEFRVYLALIEAGRTSASRLAKKTGIARTSVYSVLDRLQEKGLAVLEHGRGVQSYIAASPHTLVSIAEEQLREAEDKLSKAKQLSKLLESSRWRNAITSSKILIFEGKTSIRSMLDEWGERWRDSVVQSGRYFCGFQDESFLKYYGDTTTRYWKNVQKKRDENQHNLKLFQEQGEISDRIEKTVAGIAGKRRQLRPLPGINRFSATLWIAGEYIVVLKTQDHPHYAIQIRDSVLAENVFAVFDKLWQLTNRES